MRALDIAATGMSAQQMRVEVHLEQPRQHVDDGLFAPGARISPTCTISR